MLESFIGKMLASVDVTINGSRPWDIKVHNPRLYARVLRDANLGLGEAYMEGWWDCEALDAFFYRILSGGLERRFRFSPPVLLGILAYTLCNLQRVGRARMVAVQHYDFGNDMFTAMLDPAMQYSCALWEGASSLEEAQRNKMDLICRKLDLKAGMHVLDIGCGWGGLGRYMAREYGVRVTGVTVSKAQVEYARANSQGLDVEWLLEDYRSLTGTYDRVVSVGMFEHVGYKNYAVFMHTVRRLLASDGLFLLHTIGANKTMRSVDPWISKYIFTNGILPSIDRIGTAVTGRFIMEDWHNLGANYDRTLMAWARNFTAGRAAGAFHCSEKVARMFQYYLLSCAGAFRARDLQVWQIVLSPRGLPGGYVRPPLLRPGV
ncbi:cyclopropane fatty acyl phospholipid synthase [uncultured Desulfovibrio sp.]|uniref:cyclopropane fatty acyl phospholipid synthase n=1 Tax=Desulfovibrio legallii TaxID=571438 RepID=UPI001AA1E5BB|nr:cyclopropane fatty acyl phospholipid synthase [uncultured Desulfovibrio sp.]CAI3227708.1 Cyclopropane-fatty-acyl-phospholipid synthase (EC [Desulfovibrio diazotrophicus]VVU43125.1 Cyclopropane-fatty-acyl-phospholipid synthase (EC [Desulfovibrio diazotrophicus]